jgi:flagellar protein FlaH
MTRTDLYSLGLAERDRVDDAFGGGLPRGSVVLIEGPVGAGKSVLCQRMAHGLSAGGHRVSFVSTDLTAGGFVEQMDSLSYPVVDALLEDRLLFLHAEVGAGDGRRELASPLLSPGDHWGADVLVVDSFGALLRNDAWFGTHTEAGAGSRAMESVVRTLGQATATGTTVVLTVTDGDLGTDVLRPLRQGAEVYLELATEAVGQEIRRNVRVRRFAGMGAQVDDVIGFTVQQGRGMIIQSRTVA